MLSISAVELDPMVHLLARIAENEEVKHFLRFHKGLKEKQRKRDEAAAGLKSFLVKYPASPLKPDVEATLGLVAQAAPPSISPVASAVPVKP